MRYVAIAAVVAVGLAAAAAPAATKPPKVTVSGKISSLTPRSITIDGTRKATCRVVSISPRALGFRIGTKAKMICIKGVLEGISRTVVAKAAATATESVSSTATASGTSTSSEGSSSATSTATAIYAVVSGDTVRVSGKAAISALGGGRVSFGSSVTCSLGGDSPDVGGYKVGDRVSFRCSGPVPASFAADPRTNYAELSKNAGTLTSIEPAA